MRPRNVLAGALLLLALARPATAEETHLIILHTTDLHGALTGWDYLADRAAPRGLVKIASLVDSARATGLPVLLLDNGDTIEGAGIETVHQLADSAGPDPMMAAMSKLGYDAMAVGNHEFDFGRPALERARKQATFPWLAANVVDAASGAPAFGASIVKTLSGVRVGVVGLTTPAVPQMTDRENVAGLRFASPVDAARREVERLRAQEHCDVVVVLAHTGLERDTARVAAAAAASAEDHGADPDENWGYRLLTQVPGVDVAILGHTHVATSFVRGDAVCAQAGKNGELLGRVDLTLTRASAAGPWRIVRRGTTLLSVQASTPDEPAIAALAAPVHAVTRRALAQAVGHSARALDSPGGRLADGAVWELVHRAQLEASGADVSLAALFDPDALIDAGPVTLRDVLRIYPYDNTLGSVRLTGRQLKDVLEHSARLLEPYDFKPGRSLFPPGAPGWNFDAARGVTYELDVTRPPGDRIVNLRRHGAPVADRESLTVVANSYRLGGGGGFPWLATAPRVWHTPRRVHQLIADYIRAHSPLDVEPTAGWRVRPDFLDSPERPLIERLVTAGMLSRDEATGLGASQTARRGDLAFWLARAFGWRTTKPSGAFADVPDSLAPWMDGLLKHRVLGDAATAERIGPFEPVRLKTALDWCERAARSAGYSLQPVYDPAFRDGLLHRVREVRGDTLTRASVLGLIANLRYPEIRVLETTDFHGFILGGGRDRRSGRQLGGSAVLAAWVARLTAENPAGTVLIDGGDCFQGTMISNLQFGRPIVEQMNAMHYAAMAIGNHEFDWSADTLARRVRGMMFSALGANLRERKTRRIPSWARADTVVSRRGVRIGVLGLCYRYTPTVTLAKYVAHLTFDDDSATAARLVPSLSRRSDIVVGVGHIPAESDSTRAARGGDLPRLARGVPGVAAWFGGHSHNLVCDRVTGVPVIIAGAHGEAIGVCDLVVDPLANRVIDSRFDLVRTWADEVTPDSSMAARVERWNAAVAPLAAKKLGKNSRALRRNRGGEGTVGDLVADAMRAASGADIALQNSGGLRADLEEGDITRGAVYEVMPFDNTLLTLGLTGREVKQALEQALKYNRVTQVSGIRYSFDSSRPTMARVLTLTDAGGAPLDSTKVYRVAVNDFMATGGDNYDVLSGGRDRQNPNVLVRDALEQYIVERCAKGSLDVAPDGRIQRVGGRGDSGSD